MNSLLSRALELQRIAHELMCFGMDGTPVYSDTFWVTLFFRINDKKDTFSVSVFSLSVVLYRNARE